MPELATVELLAAYAQKAENPFTTPTDLESENGIGKRRKKRNAARKRKSWSG